jgi:outer membrane protein assembly factor BamB
MMLFSVLECAPGGAAAHEWPMVAGNPGWTSFSPDKRVRPPFRLKWAAKTESCLKSGAVVAGGRVFLKSFQGPLLCFDAETGAMLWERDHDLGFYKNTPPSSDGRHVFIRDGRKELLAVDAASGKLLWKTIDGRCSGSRPSPAFADGLVYWGKRDEAASYVCALRVKDGKEAWKTQTGSARSRLSTPILVGDLVLCTSRRPSAAFALDRATGKEVWRTQGVEATQALSSDGVRAWAAKPSQGLVALDVKTGKELWRWGGVKGRGVFVKAGTAAWAPAAAYGCIYAKSYYGYFTALDPETGKVAWSFDDGAGTGCATPSAAGGYVYFTTGNYRISTQGGRGIYAIDPKAHKAVWSYRAAGRICARPAIAYGRLYVPCNDGRLYCFEPCAPDYRPPQPQAPPARPPAPLKPLAKKPTGEPGAPAEPDKPAGGPNWPMYGGCPARCGLEVNIEMPLKPAWKFQTGGTVRSSPVIETGTVYVGSDSGSLFALDLATGRQTWTAKIGSRVRSAPAAAGGTVVCGADDGVLRAFAAADGTPKWTFRTGGPIQASPAIVGERVVFGSHDHRCYCLRLTDGAEFWRYRAGHEIHAAPAVAAGTVYVGAWDWRVHALDLGTGKPLERFGKGLSRQRQKWLANRRPGWYLNPTRLGRVEGLAVYRNALAVCASGDESYGQSFLLDAAGGDLLALSGGYLYKEIMDRNGWAFGAPAFSGRWMFIPYAWKGTGVLDVQARKFLGDKPQHPGSILNTPLATKDLVFTGTKQGMVEVRAIWGGDPEAPAKLLWEWNSGSGRKIATAPAAADGVIVVGSDDGHVYAFTYDTKTRER